MKTKVLAGATAALVLLLGACSSSPEQGSRPSSSGAVTIKSFTFKPAPLTVKVGQKVTWTNQDQILHTSTSGEPGSTTGVFDGAMDGVGLTFSFTFATAGRFPYFCSRHNGMRGEIVVEP
ncbi:MAG: plastocyanin/azurin family copper-binding protein [Actinomycetota bacterium]